MNENARILSAFENWVPTIMMQNTILQSQNLCCRNTNAKQKH